MTKGCFLWYNGRIVKKRTYMKKQIYHTNTLSINEMLNLICSNLAHFNKLYHTEYLPLKNLKNVYDYVTYQTEKLQKDAQLIDRHLSYLRKIISSSHNETNVNIAKATLDHMNLVIPYDTNRVIHNKEYAKKIVKDDLPLHSFKIVYAPHHKMAQDYDSVGQINLFGKSNLISPQLKHRFLPYYTTPKSFGPLFDNYQVGTIASQESIGIFLSKQTPKKNVYHQIWVNDEIMVQANFRTNLSLDAYSDIHEEIIPELFYHISHAEAITRNATEPLSAQYVEEEANKLRFDYIKRENEKYMEQYLLLTIELFCQIVQQMKYNAHLINTSNIFNNINKLPLIREKFTDEDIKKMQEYLEIRNAIAHPTHYNLRPLGVKSVEKFVPTMVKILSNLFYIDEDKIYQKIQQSSDEKDYSVRFLILVADSCITLKKLCIKYGNLDYQTPDPFVKLGFITKEENAILTEGILLRNDLCHKKLDENLANKAIKIQERMGDIVACIADKIADKFHITIEDYLFRTQSGQNKTVEDMNRLFPGVFISSDPDKEILEKGLKNTKNREILSKLYSLACTINAIMFENEPPYNNPFYEREDLIPFIREVNMQLRTNPPRDGKKRSFIFRTVLNKWQKDKQLPNPKKRKTLTRG